VICSLFPRSWGRLLMWSFMAMTVGMTTGCSGFRIGSKDAKNYGPIVRGGLKSVNEVPPNCESFARGRVSVSQCYNDSSCRPCIVLAVRDIPPAKVR
jgi:hypothetical protein